MCFLTSWVVLLLGEPFHFTPWGIASGIFWVPGGTAGTYAIRTIGLAASYGLWSSIIVMTSFMVGIFIFHEGVKSISSATAAAFLLIAGIGGMARYSHPSRQPSAPPSSSFARSSSQSSLTLADRELEQFIPNKSNHSSRSTTTITSDHSEMLQIQPQMPQLLDQSSALRIRTTAPVSSGIALPSLEIEAPISIVSELSLSQQLGETGLENPSSTFLPKKRIVLAGYSFTQRQLGIAGAVFNGLWGGSNLIPMHYARYEETHKRAEIVAQLLSLLSFAPTLSFRLSFNLIANMSLRKSGVAGGLGYIFSFASGSMLVTILLWVVRYFAYVYQTKSYKDAFYALPSFHLRQLWFSGVLAGTLYSIGNLCSILSVMYLGQGVGYSVVQSAMLVSGLWGIFYYGEIRGSEMIIKWLCAAIVTMMGILWLSYEHQGGGSRSHR